MAKVLSKGIANGRRAQRRRLLALLSGIVSLITYLSYESANPKALASEGEVLLLSNHCQDDLRLIHKRAIQGAKESIFLTTYSLYDPSIIAALRKAREQGVRVVVLTHDPNAEGLLDKIREPIELIRRKERGLAHQKILIVDSHDLLIGSANMTFSSLRSHGNSVLAFNNPHLAKMLEENILSRKRAGPSAQLPHHLFEVGGQTVEFWQACDPESLPRLLSIIASAKEHLRVAMFTFTHARLAESLIEAKARGVKVEVVIDGSSGAGVSKAVVSMLQSARLDVRLSLGPELLHHKLLIADDKLIMGSTNWTKAAFEKNEDCFVVLHDLQRSQMAKVDQMWRVISLESKAP